MTTYKCPKCGGNQILIREVENRFYEIVDLQPDTNYYESGEECTKYNSVLDQDFMCSSCWTALAIEDIIIERDEEFDEDGRVKRCFASKQAAQAFVEGIEFVNDSLLTVDGPHEGEDGRWHVYLTEEF